MIETRTLPSILTAPIWSKPYQPFGGSLSVFYDRSAEIVLAGPAGTGKTRGVLEKLHLCATKYRGMRGLMVRKTRESLTQSGMVTYEKLVVPNDGKVNFRTAEQEYRYTNGSVIVLGGMDKYSKIMSTEYDMIVVLEATELTIDDWEALTTRARFGVMPYNQVVGDCNPGPPNHWIKQREKDKKLKLIPSYFEDNPVYYDMVKKQYTVKGAEYLEKLDALTGVRFLRLRKGIWAAAEGMIFTEWDEKRHLIYKREIPKLWQRIWVVDFGYTNPFVLQVWAIDPDGRMFLFAEFYKTQTLVEDVAAFMKSWRRTNNEPMPSAVICDWDAEDRATLEKHLGIDTVPADKTISTGLQAVKSRLRDQDRLYICRDAVMEMDYDLQENKKPTCTAEEIEGYEWAIGKKNEEPKKVDDHGMDTMRYAVMYIDGADQGWSRGPRR